jgi:branched-chain amino acid transport system ATP-binding protein
VHEAVAAVAGQGENGQLPLSERSEVAVAAHRAEIAEPILRLRGVGRRFGGLHAVEDVNLEVSAGDRRAILGPNGAGKTTLFNLIAGEFPPTAGAIELFGSDVTREPARRRAKVGLARTYQQSRVFVGLSVEDNIYLAALGVRTGHTFPFRVRKRDAPLRERVREAAREVRLEHRLQTMVSELSHGERRQLAIGMAQVAQPKLMMLDEPAAGLSRAERVTLTELLLKLPADVTLLLIEHDMDVALRVATWVTMMHDGRVIVEGTPSEIRANETVHELYLGARYYDE